MLRPVLLLALCLAATAGDDDWYRGSRELYHGIPVAVRFAPADEALAARVWASLESVDAVYNDYRDSSEIGRINAGGVAEHRLSPDLSEAFALAARMRAATGGACEITVGPLRRLWRAAEKTATWPDDAALAAARLVVGPEAYACEGEQLRVLRPGVKFDFGGVCKGMAVDRAVALIKAAGRRAWLVQVGGETGCFGSNPSGRPHRLGIPHPDAPDDAERMWCRLQDPGQGMCGSTSGNYRNPIVISGKVCYHIYDPRTALPTDTHVLSVSVAFPGCGRNGEADALTKAGIVLGPPGLALIERAGAQALILLRAADGSVSAQATAGWAGFLAPEGPKP
jgi:thiamine biosynthesis lipoprotein